MNDSSFVAPIINQLIAQMVYILPALLFITIIKTSWFKGKVGEFWINTNVKMCLDEKVYRLIKNVTLPTDDGSTQIDHIVVSVYGVFIITKSFSVHCMVKFYTSNIVIFLQYEIL